VAGSVDIRMAAIRKLITEDHYVVDPSSIADAIVTRCIARHLIAGTAFRSEQTAAPVRSFRRCEHARSFRPCGTRPRDGAARRA
jgi:hypothetical protein